VSDGLARTGTHPPIAARFEGLGVVVTGAGSGIGRAAALRLAAEGGRVICLDLDSDTAAATARIANEREHAAWPAACDITDDQQVAEAITAAGEALGGVDVFIANAGVPGPVGPVTEMPTDELERLIAVNLTGQVICAKHAIRHMITRGGGTIVFTASHVSFANVPGWTAYSATKGGILSLTRGLAVDHAPDGIRVNCVCPGPIDTPLLHSGWHSRGEGADRAIAHQGRMGTPEEVAAVIAFLASPEAALVTGAALIADGAATAHMGTSWPSSSYWS
jgi:NAD(P)-dependent dehydrogenase (short-subunit alcohol dehydrogenase family)